MSPRWAICGFDSRWLLISLPSLRANASSVHDITQMESFLACFSFPCLVNNSLRASSPVWANKTSRARTRERAANTPRAPAFASPVACLSRVYFLLYPQMESLLAGYCLYRYSLAISLSWVMFSVTVTLKGPHVRVSGSFYSLKHSTVSISC